MTDQQTATNEDEQVFLTDEQLAERNNTTEQTGDEENQEQEPQTPKQAWDAALAALTEEEAIEYRQRSAYAVRAGHAIPAPPGYVEPASAPVDATAQAEQDAATAKDLESKIAEAQKAGDWTRAGTLKGQLLNLSRQQNNRQATTWGWRGPTS